MSRILSDNFTSTGVLTDLENYQNWRKHIVSGRSLLVNLNSRVVIGPWPGSNVPALYYYKYPSPDQEYSVQSTMYRGSDSHPTNIGPAARIQLNEQTCYYVRYSSNNRWELFRFVNGVATNIGQWSETWSVGTTRVVRLEITNATKRVFVDGVQRISSTDNTITSGGYFGIRAIYNEPTDPDFNDDAEQIGSWIATFSGAPPIISGIGDAMSTPNYYII